jgi:hypothetical protein
MININQLYAGDRVIVKMTEGKAFSHQSNARDLFSSRILILEKGIVSNYFYMLAPAGVIFTKKMYTQWVHMENMFWSPNIESYFGVPYQIISCQNISAIISKH